MSAFMVSVEHVDALVNVALYGPSDLARGDSWPKMLLGGLRILEFRDAEILGEALIAANLTSIHARYPDTIANPENTPGPDARYWESRYKFDRGTRRIRKLGAVSAIKAVHCFMYQSCEDSSWENSTVKTFCADLVDALTQRLPGYDEAPWEIG